MAGNPGPGYLKNPAHEVSLTEETRRVQVRRNGDLLVDSDAALVMHETGHQPTYYLPRRHAQMEKFQRSDHSTYCPYKGTASYFSLAGAENAVWSYETPYDEMAGIGGYLAFYPDKVEITPL